MKYTSYRIENALKNKRIPRLRMHILSIAVTFLIVFYLYFKGKMGISSLGTCSAKGNSVAGAAAG